MKQAYDVGDELRLQRADRNDLPEWIGLRVAVAEPPDKIKKEYHDVIRSGAMVYVEPLDDRPDSHGKQGFMWPAHEVVLVQPVKVTDEELAVTVESIKRAIHD